MKKVNFEIIFVHLRSRINVELGRRIRECSIECEMTTAKSFKSKIIVFVGELSQVNFFLIHNPNTRS
ncbi:hypothetical protein Hanom_Chr02g00124171 [Helianthus anomalus]